MSRFLSGAISYIAGSDERGVSPVMRLIERIKSSSLPTDRRLAIIELTKEVAKSPARQLEAGRMGMVVLVAVLEQDRQHEDTVKATLELLIQVCGRLEFIKDAGTDSADLDHRDSTDEMYASDQRRWETDTAQAAQENCKIFAEIPNAVPLVLDILEEEDFYLRFNTIELITALSVSQLEIMQAKVLESPVSLTRLVVMLRDKRHIIRNNVLLLLTE